MARKMIEVTSLAGVHMEVRRPMERSLLFGRRKGYREEWNFPATPELQEGEYVRGYHMPGDLAEKIRAQRECELNLVREAPDREPLLADCLTLREHLKRLVEECHVRDWSVRSLLEAQKALDSHLFTSGIMKLEEKNYDELIEWLRATLELTAAFNRLYDTALAERVAREKAREREQIEKYMAEERRREMLERKWKRMPRLAPKTSSSANPLQGIVSHRFVGTRPNRVSHGMLRFERFQDYANPRVRVVWDHWLGMEIETEEYNDVCEWFWEVPDELEDEADIYFTRLNQRRRLERLYGRRQFGKLRKAHRAGLEASPRWKRMKR